MHARDVSLVIHVTFLRGFNASSETDEDGESEGRRLFELPPGLAVGAMEGPDEQRPCGKRWLACGLYRYNVRDVFTW